MNILTSIKIHVSIEFCILGGLPLTIPAQQVIDGKGFHIDKAFNDNFEAKGMTSHHIDLSKTPQMSHLRE